MSRMPSIMNHDFSQIPGQQFQRSVFKRPRSIKTTMDSANLVPILVEEILPGDTVNMDATFFARIATLLYPLMDNVFFDTFFFFVPNRIVWEHWEAFMGAEDPEGAPTEYEIPYIQLTGDNGFNAFDLADYFGIPTEVSNTLAQRINALPFRAYNLIWNEWFRNTSTQAKVTVNLDDGPDAWDTDYAVLKRGKRHDYFSSCLPWPQKGDAVSIPLGTSAPVVGNGLTIGLSLRPGATYDFGMIRDASGDLLGNSTAIGLPGGSTSFTGGIAHSTSRTVGLTESAPDSGMIADLSEATAATVNSLREAFAVQQLLELDARGGTRYTEIIKAHFGVDVPDFRLQRPEYLGGSSQPVGVRVVPQTSEEGTTPQGNLAGYAEVTNRAQFVKSFVEHGYIIGLANVRADISYQQGLHRMWSRSTRYDFYDPIFAHLGEQAVLNKEIYWANTFADEDAFGYQERWAEYRYGSSNVTGAFRSNFATPLDAWHLALDFDALPELDADFVVDDPPLSRATAVGPSLAPGHQIILDGYMMMRHARLMPTYSVPGLMRL